MKHAILSSRNSIVKAIKKLFLLRANSLSVSILMPQKTLKCSNNQNIKYKIKIGTIIYMMHLCLVMYVCL